MKTARYVWVCLAGPQRPPTCARVVDEGGVTLVVDLFGTRRRVPLSMVRQFKATCGRLAARLPSVAQEGEP